MHGENPKVAVIGRGPVSQYLRRILSVSAVAPARSPSDPSIPIGLPGQPTRPAHSDMIIFAQPPWIVFTKSLPTLLARPPDRMTQIFISANGYWWDDAKHLSTNIAALSVTAKVSITSSSGLETEPADAGLLIGPEALLSSTTSRAHFQRQRADHCWRLC